LNSVAALDIRWNRKLFSALPGTTPRRLITALLRSSRMPLAGCFPLWHMTQFWRKIGSTSFAKSTFELV